MLFNSIDFAVFLPVVFAFHWFLAKGSSRNQNLVLLISSYVFYAWWDARFLLLIVFSTVIDYFIGLQLSKEKDSRNRKFLMLTSVFVNLGLLGVFKYYNFFIDNFTEVFSFFGSQIKGNALHIILPVGISFYTFQTLSYTIDVYRNKLESTRNLISFALFVSFFPQLVAGPIERATKLLPQFYKKRTFEYHQAKHGVYLIIWGLFKKIVIADSCANYVNAIFLNYDDLNSLSLMLGAVYFAFQIYCDFSGYSDIAIGTARLFGVNLMTNFKFPYFSRDVGEFWRRWHISLSSWFRDYLYIPLGGSKGSQWMNLRNIGIIFLVSGFWHGANWTFIVWGGLNAVYFIPLFLANRNRRHIESVSSGKKIINFRDFFSILFTFILITISWVFFRSETVNDALIYLKRVVVFNFNGGAEYLSIERYTVELMLLLFIFVIIEWYSKTKEHPFFGKMKSLKIGLILVGIITLGNYANINDFIYFQF
ncbi:UNVERIFIED_CONTAM: hypothetical protein GTU68_059106 [Idotea baltica]|nr:hypothetical protein [Idotea baltica]